MVKINWTPQSRNDLVAIAEYIAQDSPKYAKIQVQRIRQRVRQLQRFTNSGRIVPEYKTGDIKELILGNYHIIYRIASSDQVDVLTVHHAARRLKL